MAAFDVNDPKSIVSPGGVGFDINCGVRLLRTNLFEKDVQPVKVNILNLKVINFVNKIQIQFIKSKIFFRSN